VCARLADIYRSDAAWEPLAALLSAEAAEDSDPAHQAELFHDAARLDADRLADPARALPLLEQAIEAAPDRPELGLELATLQSAVGRHDAALGVLRRRISIWRPPSEIARSFTASEASLSGCRASQRGSADFELAVQIDPTRTGSSSLWHAWLRTRDGSPTEQAYRALCSPCGGRPQRTRAPALSSLRRVSDSAASRRPDRSRRSARVRVRDSSRRLARGLGLERAG
jgi:tetratricopeptide (TPR) repeat protein